MYADYKLTSVHSCHDCNKICYWTNFAGAVYSSSIAIGTDVMHLASDFSSFVISLVAVYLAKKQATSRLPWGFYRAGLCMSSSKTFVIKTF